jgi:hypothetical protein
MIMRAGRGGMTTHLARADARSPQLERQGLHMLPQL